MVARMGDELQTVSERFQACAAALERRGQRHVLRFWDELGGPERIELLAQVEAIPWDALDPVVETHVRGKLANIPPNNLAPAPVYPAMPGPEQQADYERARNRGRSLIRGGKVAAFTVAGGQGTRLGFDGPKGAFPITPVRNKTLFQLFAEMITAARNRYAAAIPWFVMTSPANHDETEAFLRNHAYFGLPESDVRLFPQAMLPAFDFDGRLLLEDKHRLALAPDGHGGSLKALVASGALADMRRRGVEIISYFQVDNPLVKPFDPLFIGLHAETKTEASTKVTPKASDDERVGHVCLCDGRVSVIEYTEFPESLAAERNVDGSRRFDAANLAIHLFDVAFVERVIAKELRLPFRRAEKIVPFIDESGVHRTPNRPNGVKLETFVFDVLPMARNALVLEVDRAEEFSPVKNATGVDSVVTSKRDMIRRAARRLEQAGVNVPRTTDGEPDAVLELSPAIDLEIDETGTAPNLPRQFKPGEHVYID